MIQIQRGIRLSTLDHHLGDLAMETKHRIQSRLARNQNRRYRGDSIDMDGANHSSAGVKSPPPMSEMEVLEMEKPRQSSSQAIPWQIDTDPTANEDSADMLSNEQGTTYQDSGFATEWTDGSSESTLFINDDEETYDM